MPSFEGVVATIAQQLFDQTGSHPCLRDMTGGGIFLDGIYAWDNCSTAYVDVVIVRSASSPSATNYFVDGGRQRII